VTDKIFPGIEGPARDIRGFSSMKAFAAWESIQAGIVTCSSKETQFLLTAIKARRNGIRRVLLVDEVEAVGI